MLHFNRWWVEQIKHFAGLAVHFDREGNSDAAAYYYMETSYLIDSESNQDELKLFKGKSEEYKFRDVSDQNQTWQFYQAW